MYHFPNQQIRHNTYEQCPIFIDHSKHQAVSSSTQYNKYEQVFPQNVATTSSDHILRQQELHGGSTKSEKHDQIKKRVTSQTNVDTSNFSIEERLVAAVWVHERKRTKTSMSQIKHQFRQRFEREPPAKNTLLVWERKLFSTGSVCDAPRPGRPVNRRSHVDEVAASVRAAPTLSLRARALALRVPRTTLRTIMHNDLSHTINRSRDVSQKFTGKPQLRKVMRQVSKKPQPQIPEEVAAPAPAAGFASPHLAAPHTHLTHVTYTHVM